MRLRLAAAALGCLCLIATPAFSGQTSSRTIAQNAEEPAVCDPYIFDYAVNTSVTWVIDKTITNWFVLTAHNIDAFITLWNNSHPDKIIPPDVEFDAVIGFVLPEGSALGGPAGEYLFLYENGCFVVDVYSPPPPANVSSPKAAKIEWGSLKQWQTLGYIGLM